MPSTLSPREFVDKWRRVELKERSAAQSHFDDLCRLAGHPTPVEDDPTGRRFTFEAGASKTSGGEGWADVWKKGYFAWEYKGKHKDLDAAYRQLLQYHEALEQPPLLVVSDIEQIVVHTKFVNTPKRVVRIGLDDLLTPEGLSRLRAIFFEPERFRAPQTTEQVTRAAAAEFARLAEPSRPSGVSIGDISGGVQNSVIAGGDVTIGNPSPATEPSAPQPAAGYNIAAIRDLLEAAFTPATLRRFCQDRPTFQPIVTAFGPGHGLSDMVDRVIDYCSTHLLFDELLAEIAKENPRQYERFQPYRS